MPATPATPRGMPFEKLPFLRLESTISALSASRRPSSLPPNLSESELEELLRQKEQIRKLEQEKKMGATIKEEKSETGRVGFKLMSMHCRNFDDDEYIFIR